MSPAYTWAKAVATGTSHLACGDPCQDAIAIHHDHSPDGEPFLVAALSDGAGTASHAENGSQYGVDLFVTFVREAIAELGAENLDQLARKGAELVHAALRELADVRERKPFAYAATFLGCISTRQATALVQIGDGGIVVRNADDGAWRLVFTPQHGEYANTSYFITDADAPDRLEVAQFHEPLGQLLLFSDGLEDLLLSPRSLEVHPPFFDYVRTAFENSDAPGEFEALSQRLREILISPAVRSRSDDDASVVAISFSGEQP